jgi:hypothetical protein
MRRIALAAVVRCLGVRCLGVRCLGVAGACAAALASSDAGAGNVSPADQRAPALVPAEQKVPVNVLVGGTPAIVVDGTIVIKPAADWFAAAWRALGKTRNTCSEKELHFDYWPDGGIRNFYCHATTSLALSAVTKLAGVAPFVRGPHGVGGLGDDAQLSLHDPRDFGRYNPAFVQWLVDNAVPAAGDAQLREETQGLYDKYVRQLARVYFVVHQKLEARPAWKKQQRNLYMKAMDEKNPDWSAYYDKYSTFLGEADSDWGGYDPNLQSASVAWWLRRDVDKTAPLFLQGLEKLLRTYDGAWLDAQTTCARNARGGRSGGPEQKR